MYVRNMQVLLNVSCRYHLHFEIRYQIFTKHILQLVEIYSNTAVTKSFKEHL